MKIVLSSGFMNPICENHIDYLKAAKSLGDIHLVILNRDDQVEIKKSCPFQNEQERKKIVSELKCVDGVVLAIDKDGGVADTIEDIVNRHETTYSILNNFTGNPSNIKWIFAKGGDRKSDKEMPSKELEVCSRLGVLIQYGVGGTTKTSSSSSSLSNAFKWYLNELAKMKYKDRTEYLKRIGFGFLDVFNWD